MTAWTQKKHLAKYKRIMDMSTDVLFYKPESNLEKELMEYNVEPSNRMMVGAGDFWVEGLGMNFDIIPSAYEQAQRNDISTIRGRVSDHVSPGSYVSSSEDGSFHSTRIDEQPIGVSLGDSDAQWANEFIRRSGSYGIQQFPNPIIRHTHPEIKLGVIEFIADYIEIGNNAFEIKVVADNKIYQMFVNDDIIKRELILKWFHRGMMDVDWCYVKTLVYDGEYLTLKGVIMVYAMSKINVTLDEFTPLTKKELSVVYDQFNYQIYLEYEFEEANRDRFFEMLNSYFFPNLPKFVHGIEYNVLNIQRLNGKFLLPEPPCELCQYYRKLLKQNKEVVVAIIPKKQEEFQVPRVTMRFKEPKEKSESLKILL